MKRNYVTAPERVKETYAKMRQKQDLSFVRMMVDKYGRPAEPLCKMGAWEALQKLNNFVDLSDPDMDLPNIVHLFQTAEGMRKAGEPEWMQVTGLIHDLGKCIYLRGCDEDGTSMQEQWSIVGDTYVVGYPLPPCLVYPEFNTLNSNESAHYRMDIGLSNVHISYGHDEYLYQVLQRSGHNLPMQALYMIRYHSLYAWHKDGCYVELEDEQDRQMKPWVQRFNKYDLYTKDNEAGEVGEAGGAGGFGADVINHYRRLLDKYLPNPLVL